MIKKAACGCGTSYVDFDNQIGRCATCAGTIEAQAEQDYLKDKTYLDEKVVLRKLLAEWAVESVARKARQELEEAALARANVTVHRLSAEESMASCAQRQVPRKPTVWERIIKTIRRS